MADDDYSNDASDPRKIITPQQLADGGETPQAPSGGDAGGDADDDPNYGSSSASGATPAQPVSDIDAFQGAYNSVMRMAGPSAHYGSVQRGADGSVNYTPYGGKTSVNITDNIKTAMKFFQDHGWSQAQAAGLVANFVTESGLNPNVRPGDGGAAHDIAQWHMDRYGPLLEAYKNDPRMGASPDDTPLMKSLKMAQYELIYGAEQRAGAILKKQMNAADAGAAVSEYYERPLLRGAEASARAAKAEAIEKGLDTGPATAANGPAPAGYNPELGTQFAENTPGIVGTTSRHDCSHGVRLELAASGIDTSDHPFYAREYGGSYLESKGFAEAAGMHWADDPVHNPSQWNSGTSFDEAALRAKGVLKPGSVIVMINRQNPEAGGHIAFYGTTNKGYSDFKQGSALGLLSPGDYTWTVYNYVGKQAAPAPQPEPVKAGASDASVVVATNAVPAPPLVPPDTARTNLGDLRAKMGAAAAKAEEGHSAVPAAQVVVAKAPAPAAAPSAA